MQTQPVQDVKIMESLSAIRLLILNGLAVIGEVFIRRRMGIKHLNAFRFFTAMLLLVLICEASRDMRDFLVMYWFGYVFIFACAIQKIGQEFRFRRMDLEHSFYPGWPRICDWTSHEERKAKKNAHVVHLD